MQLRLERAIIPVRLGRFRGHSPAPRGLSGTTGETDPSADFGDLVAQTTDDFGALNHARDVVAEPASGEDIDPFSSARPPLSMGVPEVRRQCRRQWSRAAAVVQGSCSALGQLPWARAVAAGKGSGK